MVGRILEVGKTKVRFKDNLSIYLNFIFRSFSLNSSFFQTSTEILMKKRIRTAMKTTVCSAFKTVRLMKRYQIFKGLPDC